MDSSEHSRRERTDSLATTNWADLSCTASFETARESITIPENHNDTEKATSEEIIVSPPGVVAPALEDVRSRMSKSRAVLIAIPLFAATFVFSMDNYILALAMPQIVTDLAANDASYAWIESSELLAWAIAGPVFGRGSDIFGRKALILASIAFHLVGTALGGASINIAMLFAGRVLQGLGCGGISVMANICVADLFSGRQRATYYGYLGTVMGVASAVGPSIGGALASKASWRWCFWINLPVGTVAFFATLFVLDLPKPKGTIMQGFKSIDWLGILAMVAATVLFLVGLQFGGTQYPWNSAPVIIMLVTGGCLFPVFFLIEMWVKEPLLPLRLFQDRSRLSIIGVVSGQSLIACAAKLFLPLYLQLTLGVSPLVSALYLLPLALISAVVFPVIGWILKETGRYRLVLLVGSVFLTVGTGLLINSKPSANWPLIIIPQILLAIGDGLTFQSPTIAFQAQVYKKDIAAAQSSINFVRNFSEMVSAVLGQVVFQAVLIEKTPGLAEAGLDPGLLGQIASGQAITLTDTLDLLPQMQRTVLDAATAASFDKMWIAYAAIAGVCVLMSLGVSDKELEESEEAVHE